MDTAQFERFAERLVEKLERLPEALGAVALGSMGATNYAPDRYSDHDFWILAQPGSEKELRKRRDFLPDSERIVLFFQETEHGVKVVYDDGHLLEFAVFTPEELPIARAQAYRVLFDRAKLSGQMAKLKVATDSWADSRFTDLQWLYGQFLTHLLVGVGRHYRGELLSGALFVKTIAVERLLWLIHRLESPQEIVLRDKLDPYRRFEKLYPQRSSALHQALLLPTPQAADRLAQIIAEVIDMDGSISKEPLEVVKKRLQFWSEA